MRKIKVVAPASGAEVPHFDYYAADPPLRRWLPKGEVVEVDQRKEWRDEIRAGVLVAADEAAAKFAGIPLNQAAIKAALKPAAKSGEEK